MASLNTWSPYDRYVQDGLRDGNYVNAQFILICAGPPHLTNIAGSAADVLGTGTTTASDVVYPVGLAQNVALSQNTSFSRIFEIGSDRSYFIGGRSIGQLNLSRVYYHGPSLLRVLYAYYVDNVGANKIDSLYSMGSIPNDLKPFTSQTSGPTAGTGGTVLSTGLHDVKVSPGYENLFLNLGSDLFKQPIGMFFLFRDNNEQNVGACYLEQCYVPSFTLGWDSQGLIMQESTSLQYERLIPINVNAVKLLKGFDIT